MSAQHKADTQPLSKSVSSSMDAYFSALNGHTPPNNLYEMVLDQVEPPLLAAVLNYCDGNQSKAAEVLGINRATLRKKLRQHKLQPGSTGPGAAG